MQVWQQHTEVHAIRVVGWLCAGPTIIQCSLLLRLPLLLFFQGSSRVLLLAALAGARGTAVHARKAAREQVCQRPPGRGAVRERLQQRALCQQRALHAGHLLPKNGQLCFSLCRAGVHNLTRSCLPSLEERYKPITAAGRE